MCDSWWCVEVRKAGLRPPADEVPGVPFATKGYRTWSGDRVRCSVDSAARVVASRSKVEVRVSVGGRQKDQRERREEGLL